jgi:hypothetical protein
MNATDKQVNAIITIAQRNTKHEIASDYIAMGYAGLLALTREEASKAIKTLINLETAEGVCIKFFNSNHKTREELLNIVFRALEGKNEA